METAVQAVFESFTGQHRSERMANASTAPLPDFRLLFESAPGLYLVLAPDFTIVAVSNAYLRATTTAREQLVGRHLFDVFPNDPTTRRPPARTLRASLDRVLAHRVADTMPVQQYSAARGGRRVRGSVLEHGQFAGLRSRRRRRAHHPPSRGRDRVRPPPAVGCRTARPAPSRPKATLFLRAHQLLDANRQLRDANEELTRLRADLERRVEERTARLSETVEALRDEVAEHEDTERQLQRQRENLRVTLESIGDAVVTTDTLGRVTLLNPVAEALTGWRTAEAAVRRSSAVFRIINQNTREVVENPVARVLAEGTVVGLANHTVLVGRDGSERPIDDSAAPIRDASGTILGVVLIFRDVTERYAAEEALRASEALFRGAFEDTNVPMVITNLDNQFVRVNAAFGRLFGYAPAEMIGMTLADITHPDDLAREPRAPGSAARRRVALRPAQAVPPPRRARALGDHQRLARARRRRAPGDVRRAGSGRHRAEARPRTNCGPAKGGSARSSTRSTAAMVEISPDAHYLRGNAAFHRMFGYPPEDLPALTVADVVFPEERDEVLAQYARVGKRRDGELRGRPAVPAQGRLAAVGAGQRGRRGRRERAAVARYRRGHRPDGPQGGRGRATGQRGATPALDRLGARVRHLHDRPGRARGDLEPRRRAPTGIPRPRPSGCTCRSSTRPKRVTSGAAERPPGPRGGDRQPLGRSVADAEGRHAVLGGGRHHRVARRHRGGPRAGSSSSPAT